MSWVVTAKYTEDGSNAWRLADGSWSRRFADAAVFDTEASAQEVLPAIVRGEQRQISDPYVIEVRVTDGELHPLSARERIRANGPTIRIRRPELR
jgi:sulfite reductase (NADPH) hemoprotein beta-component